MKEAASGPVVARTSETTGASKRRRSGPFRDLGAGTSAQARQQAAAILEVLAGAQRAAGDPAWTATLDEAIGEVERKQDLATAARLRRQRNAGA